MFTFHGRRCACPEQHKMQGHFMLHGNYNKPKEMKCTKGEVTNKLRNISAQMKKIKAKY